MSVRFSMPRGPMQDQVQLTLRDPPAGISIQDVRSPGQRDVLLRADAEKVKPGLKGNLIIDASVERTVNPKNGKAAAKKRRFPWAVCRPYHLRSWHKATSSPLKKSVFRFQGRRRHACRGHVFAGIHMPTASVGMAPVLFQGAATDCVSLALLRRKGRYGTPLGVRSVVAKWGDGQKNAFKQGVSAGIMAGELERA